MPTIGPWISVLPPEDVELSVDTKAYKACAAAADALRMGSVLVIDPSSGSYSSMPGYSVWRAGVLTEWGTLELTAGAPIWVRLRQLRRELMGPDFAEVWDVVVVEDVPMMRFGRGGRGSVGKQLPLLNSVATVMAATESTHFVEIRPRQWRAYLPNGGAGYAKADDADAVMLGYAAQCMGGHAAARARARAEKNARAAAKKALRSQAPARKARATRKTKEIAE